MQCVFDHCDRKGEKRGWCRAHYMQWRRTGETWKLGTNPHRGRKTCTFVDCGRLVAAYGLCGAHAKQKRLGYDLAPIREARPPETDDGRWCSTCKQYKHHYLFTNPKQGRKPRSCDDCRAAFMREYNTRPEVKMRTRWRRAEKKYGITQAEYQAFWDEQAGLCAICHAPLDYILTTREDQRYKSAIDHDHTTGAVRGLLCGPCNCGIGNMQDDPERLESAAAYVRARSAKSEVLSDETSSAHPRAVQARTSAAGRQA